MFRKRRFVLLGGLGLLGAGAVGYGGSLAACALRSDQQAMLRPLFVAVSGIAVPDRIGAAWLREEPADTVAGRLLSDTGVVSALMLPDQTARRQHLAEVIRAEFRDGHIVLSERWVVSQTEARIAAAWVAQSTWRREGLTPRV